MTDLYIIPPLEWTQSLNRDAWYANVHDGRYIVWLARGDDRCCFIPKGGLRAEMQHACDSIDHGKELCNQHWQERMGACLVKVKQEGLLLKDWDDALMALEVKNGARYAIPAAQFDEMVKRSDGVGSWLSAALDDDSVCEEMKRDIRAWFDVIEQLRPKVVKEQA